MSSKYDLKNCLIKSLLLVLLLCQSCKAFDYPWMYLKKYGQDVVLTPLFENKSDVVMIKTCKWITPNNVVLIPNVYMLDSNRYKIEKSSCELTITNIQKDTNGIYHCNINDKYISKAMLNVHGAPKNSLLEEFTPNLIAGFATAGGFNQVLMNINKTNLTD